MERPRTKCALLLSSCMNVWFPFKRKFQQLKDEQTECLKEFSHCYCLIIGFLIQELEEKFNSVAWKSARTPNVPKTFGFIDKNTYMNSFWRKIKLEGKHFDGIIQKWITIKSSFDTLKPLNAKDIQNSVWTNYIFPLNSLLALSP